MLRIKVELVPFGNESLTRSIGQVLIANDGTGDLAVGNYKYSITDASGKIRGKLKGHDREKSVFSLLKDILNKSIVT